MKTQLPFKNIMIQFVLLVVDKKNIFSLTFIKQLHCVSFLSFPFSLSHFFSLHIVL